MTRPVFIALTNSVCPERDGEFNQWYNEVHAKDLLSLPTMRSMTRYRALQQITPRGGEPHHKYLAIYDLDDPQAAYEALVERRPIFGVENIRDLELFRDARIGAVAVDHERREDDCVRAQLRHLGRR